MSWHGTGCSSVYSTSTTPSRTNRSTHTRASSSPMCVLRLLRTTRRASWSTSTDTEFETILFGSSAIDMSASSTHVQHMVTGANTMPHVDTFSRDAIEEGATATHSNARRVNSETMILPSWTYSVLLIHPERYVSERSYIERCLVQHLQKSSTNVGGVFLRWRLIWKCSEMPICIVRYLSDMPLHKGNSDNLNPHATAKAMGKPGDQQ